MSVNLGLFWLFIKEEYRAQSSMFKSSFLMYPVFIFAISALMGLLLIPMRTALSSYELITIAHLSIFIAGVFVGGFAMLQDRVLEQRIGGIRLLLNTTGTLPVTNREMFTYFYFKDILYYILMNVLPVLSGLYASTFITGMDVNIILAAVTFIMAFIVGISACFALSTVIVRSKAISALVLVGMALVFACTLDAASPIVSVGKALPFVNAYAHGSVEDIIMSLAIFIVLSAFSLVLVREKSLYRERHYKSDYPSVAKRFAPFGKYAAMTAKEWIDLTRSGGLVSVLFSFLLPLLFLWGLLWLLSNVMTFMMGDSMVRLEFNTVFYAVIIGFFASLVYGWLNNLDSMESYKTLPVSMPDVIKAKLVLFCVLNTIISVAYLTLICVSRGELDILPFALYNMFMVSVYVGVFTAYMTGIFTNSMMFDYKVLTAYSLAVAPVLVVMVLMSFYPSMLWPGAASATVLGVIAYLLLGRIDKRWGRTGFKV